MNLDPAKALDTSGSVVVEACAGSGKTWLLSSRITRALLEGVPPRSILALTFTNKAAAEMRHRVIGHLREMASATPQALRQKLMQWGMAGEALESAMAAAPKALARFLSDPQPPTISTFHSWYIRLAAMAPLKMAGWATMTLSQRTWDLLRQAWQVFLAEHAGRVPYDRLVAQMGSGAVRAAMEDWVLARVEWRAFADQLGALRVSGEQAAAELERAQILNAQAIADFYRVQRLRAERLAQAYALVEGRDEFCGLLTRWDQAEVDDLRKVFLTLRKVDQALEEDPPSRYQLKGGNEKFVRKGKDLGVWGAQGPALKEEVRLFGEAFMIMLDQCDERSAQARTRALWACSEMLAQCLEDIMGRGHETDFSGLESKAWELLGGELAAAFHARLDTQIAHVLVDEFQDTNPVQWAMLRRWFAQYEQADDTMRCSAPKVFIVGDPKQSIYRFRRADPQVFQAAAQWLKAHYGAELLQANATRRCRQPIVDALNKIMPTIPGASRFVEHATAVAEQEGLVARLPVAPDWDAEGVQIAHALIALRARYPDLQWSDVKILVRTRTHMAAYESALTRVGIPFVSDRMGGLLAEPEVQDVIALLRFLAFPWSDIDCAHALKSPIFLLDDQQLARIAVQETAHSSGAFFDRLQALSRQPDAEPWLIEVRDTLDRWIALASQLPVHDLLDRVLHERDVFDRIAARFSGARGLQCLANLEAFIGLALDLDTGRLPSLPRFLQELSRWSTAKASETPGPGVMPNVRAVTLSTLHGAKGLEAEVVVLAGLMDREQSDRGVRWLIDWSEDRDAIRGVVSWASTDPYNATVVAALREDRRQAQDEDFNLLYVGMTRAKRALLFSATKKSQQGAGASAESESESDAGSTWYDKAAAFCEVWAPPLPQTAATRLTSVPLVWRGVRFPKTAPGMLAEPVSDNEAIRQGKALHRLLQFGAGLHQAHTQALIAEFALSAESRLRVLQAVATIMESDFGHRIFDPSLLAYAEREWPISHPAPGSIMRPDRVIRMNQTPEVWWIIDFKWQVLASERSDYAEQLASYQHAFQIIRPGAQIQSMILTAAAQVWRLQSGELVHSG